MAQNYDYEVLIIGGGPAGLSAALYLARYKRTVGVFDSGEGRSSWNQVNYNFLGFPQGIEARELRQLGRRQLGEYDQVKIIDQRIDEMSRDGDLFVAHAEAGEWRGRAVILCTGVVDYWPQFPCWQEYVGRSMFWCITCDGYSSRGMKLVVVGSTDHAAVTAIQLKRFTDDVTIITNQRDCHIGPKEQERLHRAEIPLIHDTIKTARGTDGQFESIETTGGLTIPLDRLFNQQGARPLVQLALDLGAELDENGYISVDSEQKTNVPGLYAAGDVDGLHSHQITTAVHEGGQAASAANYYLYPPSLKHD